jgi:hypothetical protein
MAIRTQTGKMPLVLFGILALGIVVFLFGYFRYHTYLKQDNDRVPKPTTPTSNDFSVTFQQRRRQAMKLAGVSMLFGISFCVTGFFLQTRGDGETVSVGFVLFAMGVLSMGGVVFALIKVSKCPNCNEILKVHNTEGGWGVALNPEECPHCKARLK